MRKRVRRCGGRLTSPSPPVSSPRDHRARAHLVNPVSPFLTCPRLDRSLTLSSLTRSGWYKEPTPGLHTPSPSSSRAALFRSRCRRRHDDDDAYNPRPRPRPRPRPPRPRSPPRPRGAPRIACCDEGGNERLASVATGGGSSRAGARKSPPSTGQRQEREGEGQRTHVTALLLGFRRVVDEERVERERVGEDKVPHVVATDRERVERLRLAATDRHLDLLEVRVHRRVDACQCRGMRVGRRGAK